jgi:hypothetical protein
VAVKVSRCHLVLVVGVLVKAMVAGWPVNPHHPDLVIAVGTA